MVCFQILEGIRQICLKDCKCLVSFCGWWLSSSRSSSLSQSETRSEYYKHNGIKARQQNWGKNYSEKLKNWGYVITIVTREYKGHRGNHRNTADDTSEVRYQDFQTAFPWDSWLLGYRLSPDIPEVMDGKEWCEDRYKLANDTRKNINNWNKLRIIL